MWPAHFDRKLAFGTKLNGQDRAETETLASRDRDETRT